MNFTLVKEISPFCGGPCQKIKMETMIFVLFGRERECVLRSRGVYARIHVQVPLSI